MYIQVYVINFKYRLDGIQKVSQQWSVYREDVLVLRKTARSS
jgi:hypothetical protein